MEDKTIKGNPKYLRIAYDELLNDLRKQLLKENEDLKKVEIERLKTEIAQQTLVECNNESLYYKEETMENDNILDGHGKLMKKHREKIYYLEKRIQFLDNNKEEYYNK